MVYHYLSNPFTLKMALNIDFASAEAPPLARAHPNRLAGPLLCQ
jgi:hypothetical protein